MDNQAIMSAAAGAAVPQALAGRECWQSFAPGTPEAKIRGWIAQAAARPRRSLKSSGGEVELRIQAEHRLGVAAVLSKGEVRTAFPFVMGGHQVEVEIVDLISADPPELEGWVIGRWKGLLFTFFDVLHSLGQGALKKGQVREFIVNALALSLREVKEQSPVGDTEAELEWPMRDLRLYLARSGSTPDRGVFQSPVEADPQIVRCLGRTYGSLPISLCERGTKRLSLDLLVAPELLTPTNVQTGHEVAGVIWLQGYLPELLTE